MYFMIYTLKLQMDIAAVQYMYKTEYKKVSIVK